MIQIQSQSHSYSVVTAATLQMALKKSEGSSPLFYLVDEKVSKLYAQDFVGTVDSNRLIEIAATEEQKSYDRLGPIFLKLIEAGFRKDSKLVVVGGGVLQDVGCFIASVLNRGVQWDLIPTTLLSQCDSCIGSKSSVNLGRFKNQLGTFYPPRQVTLCFPVLRTLQTSEIRSGIGEMIKLALVAGPTHVDTFRRQLKILPQDPTTLEDLIMECLKIKKVFIEQDEFDRGPRNLLNYGHTFGHAFESATHYAIPHGTAVLIGIAAATYFSEKLEMVQKGYFEELNEWIYPYYSPYEEKLKDIDLNQILNAMKTDKKNTGNKVNCILTRGAGLMEKKPLDLEQNIAPLLSEFLSR